MWATQDYDKRFCWPVPHSRLEVFVCTSRKQPPALLQVCSLTVHLSVCRQVHPRERRQPGQVPAAVGPGGCRVPQVQVHAGGLSWTERRGHSQPSQGLQEE